MRIRTDGKFAYREELVDDVAQQLGENTRVGGGRPREPYTVAQPAKELRLCAQRAQPMGDRHDTPLVGLFTHNLTPALRDRDSEHVWRRRRALLLGW